MPPSAITVRPATHEDFAGIAPLMAMFMEQHHHWQPDQFRPTLLGFTAAIFQTWLVREDELHLAAEWNGAIAGYASATRWHGGGGSDFTYPHRGVHIGVIGVAPGMRRKGVGLALFRRAEAWATDFNAEFIGLNVLPQNDAAKAFYTALGYELVNEYRSKRLRTIKRMTGV